MLGHGQNHSRVKVISADLLLCYNSEIRYVAETNVYTNALFKCIVL